MTFFINQETAVYYEINFKIVPYPSTEKKNPLKCALRPTCSFIVQLVTVRIMALLNQESPALKT